MDAVSVLYRQLKLWPVLTVLALVLAGCGGNTPAPFAAPPAPSQGATPLDLFYVSTVNYYTLYTADTAPFDFASQFSNEHYPVPISYQAQTAGPDGYNLPLEAERSVEDWAEADPRVAIVSRVSVGEERVRVILVEQIIYNNVTNAIGLTKLISGGRNPHYDVYIATTDPISKQPMSAGDVNKTLTHELGHVFGLGHSPDERDLMYYRSSGKQGVTRHAFLTYGDAMAIWSTLNTRRINWMQSRPTITFAAQPQSAVVTRAAPVTRVTDAGGEVVCVYTK